MTRRQFLQALAALSLAAPAVAAPTSPIRTSGPAVAETLPLLVMGRTSPLPGIARAVVNKGVPATVVALTSSPVGLVSTDAALSGLSGLDGREVLLPFGPGEMPDLLLRALAGQTGVSFVPRHAGNALEAANLLLLGQGHCALLSEPAATLALSRATPGPGPALRPWGNGWTSGMPGGKSSPIIRNCPRARWP